MTTDPYQEFISKKTSYIKDAFTKIRTLREKYKDIAAALLTKMTDKIREMYVDQKTIIKDVSYFKNYIQLSDVAPPMPVFNYRGPKTSIQDKDVPLMPIFRFTPPQIDLETVSLTALGHVIYLQFNKDYDIAEVDFENAYFKYLSIGTLTPANPYMQSWMFPVDAKILLSDSVVKISAGANFYVNTYLLSIRSIRNSANNVVMDAYVRILAGDVDAEKEVLQPTGTLSFQNVKMPITMIWFTINIYDAYYREAFQGIRLMSLSCRGSYLTETQIWRGWIIIAVGSTVLGQSLCFG